MGSLFRSEEMTLAQLLLQTDSAYACMRELGALEAVQFRDLNCDSSSFQRKFVNEIRNCDEAERRIRYLMEELKKIGVIPSLQTNVRPPDPQKINDLQSQLELLEVGIREVSTNEETLKKNLSELIEMRHVLTKTEAFFVDVENMTAINMKENDSEGSMLLPSYPRLSGNIKSTLTFMAGVIAFKRLHRFEIALWRACHAKVFVKHTPILTLLEDPFSGAMVQKHVFVLFFQGEQLRTRVRKICEGFKATLYHCPESATERMEMATALSTRIDEYEEVLHHTHDQRVSQLYKISRDVGIWLAEVKKAKIIFHTLNMCNYDMTQKCLVAECWCPVESLGDIQSALRSGTEYSGSETLSIVNRIHSSESPPTYFKTNKFTRGFQAIVDSYGIASYREVNPTPYTIITFPFLFAVMFGDAGHGLIMTLAALFLIIREKHLKNFNDLGEMFDMIFNGRYLILMMGLFSMYTGLLYNDIFSKSVNMFGSQWDVTYSDKQDGISYYTTSSGSQTILPAEAMEDRNPYPFGIDPIWQLADNKLIFLNSMKMKMSIILGVMHMIFGIILSVFNYRHFNKRYSIWTEFVPQMIFISSIFGYMVLLIIIKWCSSYTASGTAYKAPNILTTTINMFINPNENVITLKKTTEPLLFSLEFQQLFQHFLVFLAVICVPWMLFLKPFYLRRKFMRKRKHTYGVRYTRAEGMPLIELGSDENSLPEPEKFEMGEVLIQQAIHTIEFCLSSISNTASYLRLWALSLAHAQLSEVLWSMILSPLNLQIGDSFSIVLSSVYLFFSFAVWAVFTVAILIVMEGLSAFLHALRLHWVEFQSKFYSGEGYTFVPFTLDLSAAATIDSE